MRFDRLNTWLFHLALAVILAGAFITFFTGESGSVTLSLGMTVDYGLTEKGDTIALPFTIRLTDCGTEFHTGTATARDYFAAVDVVTGDTPSSHRISMNNPLETEGYTFCMSTIGDEMCRLTLNHDPWGVRVSFAGYYLLFAASALLLVLPGCAFRRRLRTLMTCALLALSLQAEAAPEVLQRPLAKSFGELYVEVNGRVCPMQTLAYDFCRKVNGSASYEGLTPEQVLTGWLFYYDDWKREPMIRLRSREAREMMGEDCVSLVSLFEGGRYRLEPLLATGHPSRKLIEDDERVSLITSICTGSGLKILPVGNQNDGITWHSWVEKGLTGADDSLLRKLPDLFENVASGKYNDANTVLKEMKALQEKAAGGALPSESRIDAERLYNKTFFPLSFAAITIVVGLIAFVGVAVKIKWLRKATLALTVILTLYSFYVFVLRWIVGGHVPLASGFETMLSLAAVSLLMALLCCRRLPVVYAMAVIVAGAALMVAMMGSGNPAVSPLMPVLGSKLLSLHVMLVMTSYCFFAIIALNSIRNLFLKGENERKGTQTSMVLLYPAVMLLGAGIFVGAIWAEHSWGRYWGWDPKETWALITWIVYCLPFHSRYIRVLKRKKVMNAYLAIAFITVLMTYFGVNYFMTGMHSYV